MSRSIAIVVLLIFGVAAADEPRNPLANPPKPANPLAKPTNPLAKPSSGNPLAKPVPRALPIVFDRISEPNEKAFTVLVPKGWIVEGGIFNVDPLKANGPGNSIAPKCDFAVKKDREGSVMIRVVPVWNYADLGNAPAASLFRPGQYYQGMLVRPMVAPEDYLGELLRATRPAARDIKVVGRDDLKEVVAAYETHTAGINHQLAAINLPPIRFGAAGRVVEYTENGTRYREAMITSIIDARGSAFQWSNADSVVFRAPVEEFAAYKPILDTIRGSVQMSPEWVAAVGRAMGERAKSAWDTQQYINKVNNEILENRRKTHAEIRHENWLLLTGREEYTNPFTGKAEQDTRDYNNRWTNERGEYIYTNDDRFDPNTTEPYNLHQWKRTPVRPR